MCLLLPLLPEWFSGATTRANAFKKWPMTFRSYGTYIFTFHTTRSVLVQIQAVNELCHFEIHSASALNASSDCFPLVFQLEGPLNPLAR